MEINAQNYALYRMTRKSRLVAYVLGAFFGLLGVHAWYAKQYGHFALRLLLCLFSIPFPPLVMISMIILVIDFFLTWYWVEDYNNNLKAMYHLPIDI